ncbi:hypothetical protein H4J45_07415 [Colwellia sp. BRX10-6]|uniref:hypothetical protein n=1 Tax=unclassified Colwellia TaxID=196834 RepID=UPI0015F61EDA|nr:MULTISPECIES: hypothetical protein [unclassified Colwellia]MBA6353175.1 hypothetical protein [Colwellia sp. BRX9-1]MBA6383843.1 hypothetical protein [Colwellia sp. BRX10-9]MBA6393915.1 hypothetical protein [Colwellia sp. BRX10-6]
MTQDLSASTLEAIRRNITVMSFMIIVFFFAGGYLPVTGDAIKLPLSDVKFNNPERLLYVLWMMMMAWWTYRYFALGAWGGFRGVVDSEWEHLPRKFSDIQSLIIKSLAFPAKWPDIPANRLSGIARRAGIDGEYQVTFAGAQKPPLKNKLTIFRLKIAVATRYPSTITFFLPLIMIMVAFGLTVHSVIMVAI